MSLVFNKGERGKPNYFSVNFKKTKADNVILSNSSQLFISANETKICKIECPLLRNKPSYEISLLDRIENVVMPNAVS